MNGTERRRRPTSYSTSRGAVTNPAERFAYLDAVVEAWAAQDPERAFSKVADLPAEWQRSELLQAVITAAWLELRNGAPEDVVSAVAERGERKLERHVGIAPTEQARLEQGDATPYPVGPEKPAPLAR